MNFVNYLCFWWRFHHVYYSHQELCSPSEFLMKVPSCLLSSRTLFPYRVFDEGSIMFTLIKNLVPLQSFWWRFHHVYSHQELCSPTEFLMKVPSCLLSSRTLFPYRVFDEGSIMFTLIKNLVPLQSFWWRFHHVYSHQEPCSPTEFLMKVLSCLLSSSTLFPYRVFDEGSIMFTLIKHLVPLQSFWWRFHHVYSHQELCSPTEFLMKVPSCLLSSRTLFPYRVFDEGSIMFTLIKNLVPLQSFWWRFHHVYSHQELCSPTEFLMKVPSCLLSSRTLFPYRVFDEGSIMFTLIKNFVPLQSFWWRFHHVYSHQELCSPTEFLMKVPSCLLSSRTLFPYRVFDEGSIMFTLIKNLVPLQSFWWRFHHVYSHQELCSPTEFLMKVPSCLLSSRTLFPYRVFDEGSIMFTLIKNLVPLQSFWWRFHHVYSHQEPCSPTEFLMKVPSCLLSSRTLFPYRVFDEGSIMFTLIKNFVPLQSFWWRFHHVYSHQALCSPTEFLMKVPSCLLPSRTLFPYRVFDEGSIMFTLIKNFVPLHSFWWRFHHVYSHQEPCSPTEFLMKLLSCLLSSRTLFPYRVFDEGSIMFTLIKNFVPLQSFWWRFHHVYSHQALCSPTEFLMKVPSCLLSSRTLFPYRVFDEGSIMFTLIKNLVPLQSFW